MIKIISGVNISRTVLGIIIVLKSIFIYATSNLTIPNQIIFSTQGKNFGGNKRSILKFGQAKIKNHLKYKLLDGFLVYRSYFES